MLQICGLNDQSTLSIRKWVLKLIRKDKNRLMSSGIDEKNLRPQDLCEVSAVTDKEQLLKEVRFCCFHLNYTNTITQTLLWAWDPTCQYCLMFSRLTPIYFHRQKVRLHKHLLHDIRRGNKSHWLNLPLVGGAIKGGRVKRAKLMYLIKVIMNDGCVAFRCFCFSLCQLSGTNDAPQRSSLILFTCMFFLLCRCRKTVSDDIRKQNNKKLHNHCNARMFSQDLCLQLHVDHMWTFCFFHVCISNLFCYE